MIIYRPSPGAASSASPPAIQQRRLSVRRVTHRASANSCDSLDATIRSMPPVDAVKAGVILHAFQHWLAISSRSHLVDQLLANKQARIDALLAAYVRSLRWTALTSAEREEWQRILAWIITMMRTQHRDRQDPMPDILTMSDLELLWLSVANDGNHRRRSRDLALLGLLINPQLDPTEIIGLTCDDCRQYHQVLIRDGREGALVGVVIGEDTYRAIVHWMHQKPGGATGPLLVHVRTRPGPHLQPLSVPEVSDIVRAMGKRLNRQATPARIQAAARVAVRIADLEPHQLPLPNISLPSGFPPAAPQDDRPS